MLNGSKFLGDLLPFFDDGRGLVTEVGDKGRALFRKLDKVDEGGENEACTFWFGEVEILCTEVHDTRRVCKAGDVVDEEVVCDAGDVEILKGGEVSGGMGGETYCVWVF